MTKCKYNKDRKKGRIKKTVSSKRSDSSIVQTNSQSRYERNDKFAETVLTIIILILFGVIPFLIAIKYLFLNN